MNTNSRHHLAGRVWNALVWIALGALLAFATAAPLVAVAASQDEAEAPEPTLRVGKVVLGDAGVTGSDKDVCFSAGFLTSFARETGVATKRAFARTTLASDALFDYPFIVLAGQGEFALSDGERDRLEAYIRRGGFVLASAGCSNAPWAASFRDVADELLGERALEPMADDHPIFRILYEIEHVDVRLGDAREAVLGYEVDGVTRLIFSPIGLNDTDRAGGGCCCCGGNEIRNARLINANILAYALTH